MVHKYQNNHNYIVFVLVLFLLVFPKGGIKIADIPTTWGYLLLAILFVANLPYLLLTLRSRGINVHRVAALMALMPFQLFVLMSFYTEGIGAVGFSIALLTSFIFLPWCFILVFGRQIDSMDKQFLIKSLRLGIFAVSIYGIFLQIYKTTSGNYFEIPFLTINYGDIGTLEEKFNNRGDYFKLISTYNNGNIFGVCLLMLLPLYQYIEKSFIKRLTVKVALFLTLSRTVWIGLLLFELFTLVKFDRSLLKRFSYLLLFVGFMLFGIYYVLNRIGLPISFIFDSGLGGRVDQLEYLSGATLLPTHKFEGIQEIVYVSVLDNFGGFGLLFFVIGMTFPLIVFVFKFHALNNHAWKKSIALGLLIYLIIAMSDGAIMYIPTMAFYWFLVSLLLSQSLSSSHMKYPITADIPRYK